MFPLLAKHLSSSNYIVHKYPAITIERLTFRFTKTDIKLYAQELLINLFRLIEAGTIPETLAENDYHMKAIMHNLRRIFMQKLMFNKSSELRSWIKLWEAEFPTRNNVKFSNCNLKISVF
ncbi:unnamed protein product [Rhizophagus irregularis]|uniref:Exportin-2 C-terminal domain-containing protein n=1 Tax=Rhizophagus irregularis TaxID=588596 RepID=A0A915YNB2_9GLOM|nr:unnamed protein product [Rhizophagus irregularis]